MPPASTTMLESDSSSSDSDVDSDEEYEKFCAEQTEKQLNTVVFDAEETPQQLEKMTFTLKQLIRKLHITEPVEHVMCLIGKKYPMTLEEFYRSRLPGIFEEERAGKRMKLPVPETWETQVSLKGNNAPVWEQLLDNRKLPFMAMLRNLRNMIKAGISRKHHNMVIRRLTDERSVIGSKQFPFRFFSAYEVLDGLLKDYEKSQEAIVMEATLAEEAKSDASSSGRGRGRGRGRGTKLTAENWWIEKRKKKEAGKKTQETPFDAALIQRYRKALDTSVKLATVYNVQPIRGHTVILCDVGPNMEIPCTAARGLGKPRTMKEVSVLLGLMCKYSCENCTLVIFDSTLGAFTTVELNVGTILENMDVVLNKEFTSHSGNTFSGGLPTGILLDMLRDRTQMDNLLLLTGNSSNSQQQRAVMATYLESYRRLVNPSILYVNVSFEGKSCGFASDIKPEHDNNIYISGFSDQILRFIAERGEGGQLRHVEKIDEAFNLKPLPPTMFEKPAPPKLDIEKPLPVALQTPSWRTARVFISSTFRDMHGERDLLTRFVFPELRALGKKHFINVHEVDLRWGVTEEDTRSNKTLELCLSEIERCQLFIGMLGERYGWVPDKYMVPDLPKFDWLKNYPTGRSVTELEMYSAALSRPQAMKDRAFFFLRDSTFARDIPKSLKEEFDSESAQHKEKIDDLKNKIRHSGLEVFDNYSCQWGGVVDGKPIVSGLEQFGLRALNNLWNAIQKLFPDDGAVLDEMQHTTSLHAAYSANLTQQFVGRKKLLKDTVGQINHMMQGIINMTGKPGTGKSSLLASVMGEYAQQQSVDHVSILEHFVGAAPGSTNVLATLRRLCHDLNHRFSLQMELPEDYKNLVAKFGDMLKEAAVVCGSRLVLFIDNIDSMEPAYLPHNLDWIPAELPENVVIVMTSLTGGKLHETLKRLKVKEITVEGLDMWDKTEVIRSQLATHRKTLDESPFNNQMKLLVAKKEANLALYLKLACEELRVFGLFEKMTPKLKSLPQTVPLLLQEVMSRIENDVGTSLTAAAFTLLICCRDGLTMDELHELLNLYKNVGETRPSVSEIMNMKPSPDTCVPAATIAHLQTALHSFVNPTDSWNSCLILAHVDIITAVRQKYLKGASSVETELFFQKLLAGYFFSQADPDRDGTWTGKSARAFKELPYHLAKGGCYGDLSNVTCNLQFIYNKCMMGMATQLLEDYQPHEVSMKTLQREQSKMHENPTFKEYKSFVSRNLYILSSHPALTWQQTYNESAQTRPAKDVRDLLAKGTLPKDQTSLIQWNSKPTTIDPCYLTLANLPQAMTCVCISPNNEYFAGGSEDGLVILYDLKTGKELKSFRGHADAITDVCFAGNNKLCSASLDTNISIWDFNDGHRLFTLKKHQRRVNSCSSDLSGKLLATASWDCCIQVISVNKGDSVCDFKVGSPVNCVAFHPEGQLIVSGQWDSTIKIWDIFHKTKKAVLRGHMSSVRDVAYSPSGNYIASAAMDGDVKLWAAYLGAQVGNIQGHALPINKLTFSPTGNKLITVSDDHKVKVWSGHLGKPVSTLGNEEMGPAMSVTIATSQDMVAIGYHSGWIRQFDVLTGHEYSAKKIHSASVRCIKYLSHGHILSGADDNKVLILRDDLKVACVVTTHEKSLMCLDVSRDFIATASEDCTCRIFDNGLKYGTSGLKKTGTQVACLKAHIAPVTSCSFNKDGSRLATGSRDTCVYIWDMIAVTLDPESATPLMTLANCHSDWVSDCKWSNIGDTLVTGSVDFNLKVWDLKTGKEKMKLSGHLGAINHVAYNNGCILSTCSDGSAKVWSHRGVEITTLYGHTQRANGCDISVKTADNMSADDEDNTWSDDKGEKGKVLQPKIESVLIATCGDEGTVRLWYPLQANELACFTGHSDKVVSVASQTNGSLCTSSRDQSVKLWTCSQDDNATSVSHNAPVTFVANNEFSLDGFVLSGSRDGEVKLWQRSDGIHGDSYSCCFTFKAHQRAVTCGAWVSRQMFVTGSDDETVSIWKLNQLQGKFTSPRKLRMFTVSSPVLNVTTNRNEEKPVIVTSEWSGLLSFYTLERKIFTHHTGYGFTSWLLRLQWVAGRKPKVLATTTDGYVYTYTLGDINKTWTTMEDTSSTIVPITEQAEPQVADHKKEANWILDVKGSDSQFITVDSCGQVSYMTKEGTRTSKKIHSCEATCVLEDGQFIFTASRDKTIKVWSKTFKQVGQFFTQSPVTSMSTIRSTPDCTRLTYGDELGFVHFLNWRA